MKASAAGRADDAARPHLLWPTCGGTLARAHARCDAVALAGYLGDNDEFDRAITDFAVRYADQNERDYQDFVTAVRSGQLEAL